MRGTPFRLFPGLLFAFLPLAGAGCAGRAEFRIGLEHDLQGDFRGAYRHYHEAYRRSGGRKHRSARDRVGAQVADGIRYRAVACERAGDLWGAREEYLRALEYDPDRGRLCGDYLRVQERLARLEELADRAAALEGSWEAYHLWRDLRPEAAALPEVYLRIGSAAEAAADGEIRALGGEDLEEGPLDEKTLEARLAACRALLERLGEIVDQDAQDFGAAGLAGLLLPKKALTIEVERVLLVALEAERGRAAGRRREEAGDYPGAVASYQKALLLRPDRPEIRDGLARSIDALMREASEAAAGAMGRGSWKEALSHLEGLERVAPGNEDVRRRADRCRSEIRDGILREGGSLRERGLPGNALNAFLRARLLGLSTPEIEREIALLEESIRGRYQHQVEVQFRAAAEEDESLDAALWGEDVHRTLEEATRAVPYFRPKPAGASPASSPGVPPKRGTLLHVEVEDLDFDYRLERRQAGSMESRFVSEFAEVENPEHSRAREELLKARKSVEETRAALSASLPEKRSETTAQLAIAEGWERRAVSNLTGIPATVPHTVWKSEIHPVVKVRVQATLALRTRIDGEVRWVTVRKVVEDREVEGDSQRGIPPDPPEVPSRGEALRLLAPKLLEELRAVLKAREVALRNRLLDEARERLLGDAYQAAVENLVIFLYAEREAGQGPRFAEAVELLEKFSGYELPQAWQTPPVFRPLQF